MARRPAAGTSRAVQGRAPSRADPVLAELIAAVGQLPDARDGRPDREDHYGALVRAIAGQQLSVQAPRARSTDG